MGVAPWLDIWEIRPGDSLVKKLFEEGLDTVGAVIVVVSASSAAKPWVREELDAAVVRRIAGSTRLIPVRLDDAPIPAPLQHLVWISADRTPEGIRSAAEQITDALYARDKRAAVAPPPAYTAAVPVPGLAQADSALLAVLIEEALAAEHLGVSWPPAMAKAKERGMTPSAIDEAFAALQNRQYLKIGPSRAARIPPSCRRPRSGGASTPSSPVPRQRAGRSSPSWSTTLPPATARCASWPGRPASRSCSSSSSLSSWRGKAMCRSSSTSAGPPGSPSARHSSGFSSTVRAIGVFHRAVVSATGPAQPCRPWMAGSARTGPDRRGGSRCRGASGSMECIRMRHGVDATLERLTYLSRELGNCRAANSPGDKHDRWLRWWSQADTQVRNLFSDGEMVGYSPDV